MDKTTATVVHYNYNREVEVISMFTTIRYFYPHGIEGEPMKITIKEFDDIERAIKYAHRYAKGLNFAGVQIESKNSEVLYEITSDYEIFDNRKK